MKNKEMKSLPSRLSRVELKEIIKSIIRENLGYSHAMIEPQPAKDPVNETNHWTSNMNQAYKTLELELRKSNDPNFGQIILAIQDQFSLNDYETYLVGENSTYPIGNVWNDIAGGKFLKYTNKNAGIDETTNLFKFQRTLSDALSSVEDFVDKNRIMVDPKENEPTDNDRHGVRGPYMYGGINYEQHKDAHYKLLQYKGKPTRKYLHVSIYRMPTGSYEVTNYVA